MLGRQHHERGPEQGVGPGGEDARAVRSRWGSRWCAPVERPIQLRCMVLIDSGQSIRSRSSSRRSAYAVIRIFHWVRVRVKTGKLPALAAPVGGDLLVGQDGAQAGAPVDRRLVAVGQPEPVDDLRCSTSLSSAHGRPSGVGPGAGRQLGDQLGDRPGPPLVRVEPGVEDLQEDPLGPAVEPGVGGGDAAPLVVGQAQRRSWRAVASRCWPRSWSAGAVPVCTAYCSAGRPNASKPIACSTLCPVIRWKRA